MIVEPEELRFGASSSRPQNSIDVVWKMLTKERKEIT
jgi:hypothetical protein